MSSETLMPLGGELQMYCRSKHTNTSTKQPGDWITKNYSQRKKTDPLAKKKTNIWWSCFGFISSSRFPFCHFFFHFIGHDIFPSWVSQSHDSHHFFLCYSFGPLYYYLFCLFVFLFLFFISSQRQVHTFIMFTFTSLTLFQVIIQVTQPFSNLFTALFSHSRWVEGFTRLTSIQPTKTITKRRMSKSEPWKGTNQSGTINLWLWLLTNWKMKIVWLVLNWFSQCSAKSATILQVIFNLLVIYFVILNL